MLKRLKKACVRFAWWPFGADFGSLPESFCLSSLSLILYFFARKSQKVTEMFRLLLLACAPGQTHQKNLYKFASYSQNIYLLSSHRSHNACAWLVQEISQRTHRYTRVCHPAVLSSKLHSSGKPKFPSSQPTLIRGGGAADKRGRSDAPFVRFLGRAKRKHCEICVRINHLCEGILVRLPCVYPSARLHSAWPTARAMRLAISVFSVLSVWNKRRFAFFRPVRIVIMI